MIHEFRGFHTYMPKIKPVQHMSSDFATCTFILLTMASISRKYPLGPQLWADKNGQDDDQEKDASNHRYSLSNRKLFKRSMRPLGLALTRCLLGSWRFGSV